MTTLPALSPQAALDAELSRIVELDRVIRAAQAEQFRRIEAARALVAEVEGVTDASPFVDREFAMRAFVAELGTTLVVHEATAGRLIADARLLTGQFEATLDALAGGVVCVGRVRSLLEIASTIPAERAGEFEALALGRAPQETPSAFRRRIRRLRDRIHPEPLADRQQRARGERRVCFEPAEDGMGWLSLFLEAERGIAIMAHLDALADAQQRAGSGSGGASDPRTRAQLALDFAADLLLGRTAADASPLGVVTPKIYVTVPALTLLGHTDQPAELDGYGPIDDDTARRLTAHAPSFHRILTHPETGAYLSYGRSTYRVPADLAGYLRIRDGSCRFPGCSRRANRADIDHTTDWATGGPTRHDNLAHLCRKHHRLKHHTGWRMTQTPNGDIRWTSPAGREHHSTPTHPFAPMSGPHVNAEGSAPPSPPADATQPASGTASTSATKSAAVGAPSDSSAEIEPPWATAA
ncbi:HNH endonuclease signature motif containing protein [Agromyces albus]|uniref:DUF222 domain-containing protein n=1 Tax=Agromyces albus TaxID=205332 RepID=A0A4Q2KR26_9MICO|nr:HNH endonuclease signature motif containing protein [Agromyces albus]RXZ67864.1 DUF222 domain-containing protein [Agromyces albus]